MTDAAVLRLLEKGSKKRKRSRKLFVILALTAAGMTGANARAAPHYRLTVHYRSISFRDFIVDGPTLAKNLTTIELIGAYIREGNVSVLYENMESLEMAHYGPGNMSPPRDIPLLTDQASHKFRETQYSCDQQAAYGAGCMMVVRGIATTCSLTNAFGAVTETPCIEVIDGASPTILTAPQAAAPEPAESATSAPKTNTTSIAPASPESTEQKVKDCIRSPEMAETDDVYRKCLKRIQAESSASPTP